MVIDSLEPKIILSSRGDETIEVKLSSENKEIKASIPAGISAGKYEIKNVSSGQAVQQINDFKNELEKKDLVQEELDNILESTSLGGNARLAISAVFWKMQIRSLNKTYSKFPQLLALMFEGGKHGNSDISIQEFALREEKLSQAIEDFKKLRKYLEDTEIETNVGAEGAFTPKGYNNIKVLDTMKQVFPEKELHLDIAGSFNPGSSQIEKLIDEYPIFSVEDPYGDEDWESWKEIYIKYGEKIKIVGDDLTVTNHERLRQALSPKVINAVIIKPNQNGTITGTFKCVKIARENALSVVVSHRGNETNDDWLVDLALEAEADYVKFGGIERGERIAKYNRLKELGME